ncbi:hypothetical protein AA313_de0210361 [Arthrobotrys entomopaga]|nr:hypothetical protein AA313_de0210361 [Arthrobotrys entomopaga]
MATASYDIARGIFLQSKQVHYIRYLIRRGDLPSADTLPETFCRCLNSILVKSPLPKFISVPEDWYHLLKNLSWTRDNWIAFRCGITHHERVDWLRLFVPFKFLSNPSTLFRCEACYESFRKLSPPLARMQVFPLDRAASHGRRLDR